MQESDTSSSQIQPNDLSKIDDYFEAPAADMSMDLAQFWQENQKSYQIYQSQKDILGVSSPSAPVEGLFSIAEKVFTPERCRLTDGRFEQLMIIRYNNNVQAYATATQIKMTEPSKLV